MQTQTPHEKNKSIQTEVSYQNKDEDSTIPDNKRSI